MKTYGMSGFQFYDEGPIKTIISLIRIVFFIFLSLIMLWVSMKCKNAASAILINFAVFALPVLIYLLGAEFIINIGFNPLLSVNVILNDFKPLQLVVFPITFAFIIISKIKNYCYAVDF